MHRRFAIIRGAALAAATLTLTTIGLTAAPSAMAFAPAEPTTPTLRVLCLPTSGAPMQVATAGACSGRGRALVLTTEQARVLSLGEGKALCVATRDSKVRTISVRNSCARGERKVVLYRSLVMSGAPETKAMLATPGDFGTFRVDTTASTATVTIDGADAGGSPITGYEYRLSSDNGSTWSAWIARSESPFAIAGLGPCTYAIEARGVNVVGEGSVNGPVAFALKQPGACSSSAGGSSGGGTPAPMPRVAAAPTNVSASGVIAGDGSVTATVAFTAPADPGTAAITGYQYMLSSNGGESFGPWTSAPTTTPVAATVTTSFTLTGLMPGTSYDVRVRAVTSVGAGAASTTTAFSAAAPGKPTITNVSRGSSPWGSSYRTLGLGFSYPNGTGSSAIDALEVTIPGAFVLNLKPPFTFDVSCDAGYTSCRDDFAFASVDGPHQVTVRAHNAAGWSPASDAWLLYGSPSAPAITATLVGKDSITATVSAPASTGSPVSSGAGALIGYEFGLSNDGGTSWSTVTPTGPSSPFTITGLTAGAEYRLRVRATNAGGLSSDWVTASFTTLTQPADVTGVTATYDAASGKVNVSWSPAAGAASYSVRVATSAYDAASPGTYGTASSVSGTSTNIAATLGTKYWVQVQSVNGALTSPWTTAATASALTSIASPVISGVSRTGSIYFVSWSVPSTGGYRLTSVNTACSGPWSSSNGVQAISTTSGRTTPGYCDGKPNISVTVSSASGPNATGTFTLAGPAAPTNVAASVSGTSATISYTAPDAGILGIAGYEYQFRTNGGAWSAPVGFTGGSPTLSGLTPGTAYDVQVRAGNWYSAGPWSSSASFTVGTTPHQVTGLDVIDATGPVTVSFTPLPMSDMLLRYEYRVRASGDTAWGTATSGGASSPITINGLTAGMAVDIQVRGVNALGSGDWSSTLTVTPGAQPGAPTLTLGATSGTTRSVTFTAGTVPAGATIARYGLARDDESSYYSSGSTTFSVVLPDPGTSVVLRPYVETSTGVRSAYGTAITLGGIVTAPDAPAIALSFDAHASTVTWTVTPSSSTGGADLTGYQVELSDGSTTATINGSAGAWTGTAMWNSTGDVTARTRTTNDDGMHWSAWSSSAKVTIPMVTVSCMTDPAVPGTCVMATTPDAMGIAMMQTMMAMEPGTMTDCVKQADGTMACPMNAPMVAMMNDMVTGDMPLVSNVMMRDAGVMVGPDAVVMTIVGVPTTPTVKT